MLGDCHWCIPHQKIKDQSHDSVTIESREWSSCFTQEENLQYFVCTSKGSDHGGRLEQSPALLYFLKPRDRGLHRVRALLARLSKHRTGLYTYSCLHLQYSRIYTVVYTYSTWCFMRWSTFKSLIVHRLRHGYVGRPLLPIGYPL